MATCSEKGEIARLVSDRQRELAGELATAAGRVEGAGGIVEPGWRSMEREWGEAAFGAYWAGLRDQRRTYLLEHELVCGCQQHTHQPPPNSQTNPLAT